MSIQNVELAIVLIQAIMSALKAKGMSAEEIDQAFIAAKAAADATPAEDLPHARGG